MLTGATLAVLLLLGVLTQPPTEAGQVPQAPTDDAHATAATLAEATARHRDALAEAAAADTRARQARDAGTAALADAAAARSAVGTRAAAAYKGTPAQRWPVGRLSVDAPGATADVLHAAGLVEHLTDDRDAEVARAAQAAVHAARFTDEAAAAEDAAAAARTRAAAVLAEVHDLVATLHPGTSARWAALSTSPASAEQQERNAAALAGWQSYLDRLVAADVTPPTAAELTDADDLPRGLAPLRAGSGDPVPGVATAYADGQTLTVLPAETIAAVSAAFAQLGRPYLAGQSGPDGYDCAGLTATAWTQAGLGLAGDLAGQWAQGTPVPSGQLQVGDLVFSTRAGAGLDDVGLYLGGTSVLSASADRWQVAVHEVGDLSTAVRVTVPSATPTPLPVPAAGPVTCSAPPQAPGTAASPAEAAWGGWSNGRIPADQLCGIGPSHRLRCDAAAAYTAMSAAYQGAFGTPLCITDSYRSFGAQVDAHARKPRITAVPGTSNHGWGLAVDLCGGVNVFGTAQTAWMQLNAGHFGWVHPDWAQARGQNPEPWHWEYGSLA
ncbi:D-alanyl-D-alanine carboxypeptidase family protein [Modestobacter sp. VKM Ac-2986]|uniref:NlpC/P60 family protein n=1 Tax=Modestobacter sp. VKM Ac-2986 TaxID=3004140 RepID=UPI0022AB676A|nr:NlpC/P60 family protein [Modestobacter sp. VKM Ac-2986]MCZ2830303.1 D-alanyl-D-alanine carboxypeptidase family protein [Modestobacter sp. VKM Ac-2986]